MRPVVCPTRVSVLAPSTQSLYRGPVTCIWEVGLLKLEVFVASPGDVAKERQAAKAVIEEIQDTIGKQLGINLSPFFWEHDLVPGVHPQGAQGLVDHQSNLPTCDVLVGIFWNRFGTPTSDGTTGTEHEFRQSFERWKSTQEP